MIWQNRAARRELTARRTTGPVRRHLVEQLGEPFAVLTERIGKREWIDIPGFSLGGKPDLVATITDGLADLGRRHSFAGPDGEAQELVFVLEGPYLNQATLDFLVQTATRYVEQHSQLGLYELVRLSRDVPGSQGLRYLLSGPPSLPGADLPALRESGGLTTFCQLIPLHADEAERALDLDDDRMGQLLDRIRPSCANLHRPPVQFHEA
jgi:Suppressor of fused protein (SUFU)